MFRGRPTSYQPRSDFLFLLNNFPFLLIEVQSNPQEYDCYRMLTQAGVLVRVVNSTKPKDKNSFVVVAIYITSTYIAQSIVYQPNRDKRNVRITHVLTSGSLRLISSYVDRICTRCILPQGSLPCIQVLFELHNLLSAFPSDVGLVQASSRVQTLSQQVHGANLTSLTRARNAHPKPKGPNDAPPGGSSSGAFDDPSTARKLSDAGYQVLPMPKLPSGFTPLHPVCSFFF